MDFKFEPGNYYLAGKETLEGQQVLKIDYLPTKLFDDDRRTSLRTRRKPRHGERRERRNRRRTPKPRTSRKQKEKKPKEQDEKPQSAKEQRAEEEIERKMNKSSQVTLWVDPATHQIVKYTFDNVWLDFLPAGWLVRDRRPPRVDADGPALPRHLAPPQPQHPRRRLARARDRWSSRTSASSRSIARPTSRRRSRCRNDCRARARR